MISKMKMISWIFKAKSSVVDMLHRFIRLIVNRTEITKEKHIDTLE